jgi:hypothetical protein
MLEFAVVVIAVCVVGKIVYRVVQTIRRHLDDKGVAKLHHGERLKQAAVAARASTPEARVAQAEAAAERQRRLDEERETAQWLCDLQNRLARKEK